jgi:hypothetical protein
VGLSMAERKAVTKQMARRYQGASKAEKGKMLDELCALTGWTRSSRPQGSCPGALGSRRVSAATTAQDLRARCRGAAAARVAALGGPAGKRLAPFMAEALGALERHGELECSGEVRDKLLQISAASHPPADPAREPSSADG